MVRLFSSSLSMMELVAARSLSQLQSARLRSPADADFGAPASCVKSCVLGYVPRDPVFEVVFRIGQETLARIESACRAEGDLPTTAPRPISSSAGNAQTGIA
jgi:hypothetical protein